jgi:hypothetical protein
LLAFLANTIIVWMYFFLIPLVFSVITICLALAFALARRAEAV